MFFAQSDASFLLEQFGFAGLLLFAATFLAGYLFKLWIASKERDHQKILDIQKETHLETLRQLNKRDEIRYSKLHEKRAQIIEELYNKLVETHSSVEECYDLFENDPAHAKINLAKEAIKRGDDLSEFILRNVIYFSEEFARELRELYTCLIDAAIFYEMFCRESDKEAKIKEFEGLLGEVKVDLESSLRITEIEFRALLGVEERKDES